MAVIGAVFVVIYGLLLSESSYRMTRSIERRVEANTEEARLRSEAGAHPVSFDGEHWKDERGESRVLMALTMERERALVGLTREELAALLGPPDSGDVSWRFRVDSALGVVTCRFFRDFDGGSDDLRGGQLSPWQAHEQLSSISSQGLPGLDEIRASSATAWDQRTPAWRLRAIRRLSDAANAGELTASEFDMWPIAIAHRQESWEYRLTSEYRWILYVHVDPDGIVSGSTCYQYVSEY